MPYLDQGSQREGSLGSTSTHEGTNPPPPSKAQFGAGTPDLRQTRPGYQIDLDPNSSEFMELWALFGFGPFWWQSKSLNFFGPVHSKVRLMWDFRGWLKSNLEGFPGRPHEDSVAEPRDAH